MAQARRWRWWTALGVPLAILLAVAAMGLTAGARATAQDGEEAHPAHIHTGTCAQLGDVVQPLNDVGSGMTANGTPVPPGEMMGSESAIPVLISMTTVPMALTDIVGSEHAINVHESAENIGEYIACGDIGGQMMGDTLTIGLGELNESNHAGVAVLQAMDAETLVTIYLLESISAGGGGAEPAGTPVAGGETGGEAVQVEIKDFAYNPDPVEVPVGGTVTWTNQDSAPHTATAQDREVLQSNRLDQGQSFSQTFEEAGTFEYFCEFHPNMHGTVVVQ